MHFGLVSAKIKTSNGTYVKPGIDGTKYQHAIARNLVLPYRLIKISSLNMCRSVTW